jgi:hypothetical protein
MTFRACCFAAAFALYRVHLDAGGRVGAEPHGL